MRNVLKSGKAVELMAAHGVCMSRIDTEKEDDICLVWWSEHCSCFHWAYNGEFRGIYTGSFINMVPCGIDRPEGCITNSGQEVNREIPDSTSVHGRRCRGCMD